MSFSIARWTCFFETLGPGFHTSWAINVMMVWSSPYTVLCIPRIPARYAVYFQSYSSLNVRKFAEYHFRLSVILDYWLYYTLNYRGGCHPLKPDIVWLIGYEITNLQVESIWKEKNSIILCAYLMVQILMFRKFH